MSLDAILAAIDASGQAEITQVRSETAARVQAILDQARLKATAARAQALQSTLQPVAGDCARQLYRARLEALQIVGDVRNQLLEMALAETRQRLARLGADPDYPRILAELVKESIDVLADDEAGGNNLMLEVNRRDEGLVRHIAGALGHDIEIVCTLDGWGGAMARSGDDRIVVNNTLEARLERATPWLRQELSALMER